MNHGFGKVAGVLFGEAGLAATLGMSLPDWWIAGDARAAQTALLRGGIGQYASSEMATRALLLSGDNFSFMKAMHGSLRDGVPSQEELGAFLVNHVERTTGADSWDKIMARTANHSFSPFSLSRAMKTETGRSAADNYRDTMSVLGETWRSQAEGKVVSQPRVLNLAPKITFTGYYQPVFEKDGSVLAQKAGLDTYAMEVVRISPDGRERKLFHFAPAVSATNRTSVVNGKIVWDEYVPDPRWIRGYSEILIRDISSGHTRRLTHKTRFMNPVLSPDGARIAVVEFLPDRMCSLVLLDANTGAELQRLPAPDNDMIYTPAWPEDGMRLAVVTQSGQGRALMVADLQSGAFREIIPHRDEELANPVFYRTYILYKSSRDGVVNIFAADTSTGQCYQVTAAKFGADYPSISPDGSKLLYSDYTARGYNVAELPLDPTTWTRVDTVAPSSLGAPKNPHDYSAQIPGTLFPVAPYHPSLHLFDIHSWGFTGGPPNLGFGLLSDDKMHLAEFNAGILYNTDEGKAGYQAGQPACEQDADALIGVLRERAGDRERCGRVQRQGGTDRHRPVARQREENLWFGMLIGALAHPFRLVGRRARRRRIRRGEILPAVSHAGRSRGWSWRVAPPSCRRPQARNGAPAATLPSAASGRRGQAATGLRRQEATGLRGQGATGLRRHEGISRRRDGGDGNADAPAVLAVRVTQAAPVQPASGRAPDA